MKIMKNTKLAKAIAIAVTGATLSLGVASTASAHVMYNTRIGGGTDGWTTTLGNGGGGTQIPWLGTTSAGADLPFGYAGGAPLNWAVAIHHAGQSSTVSAAQAAIDYSGAVVDLDTSDGAWGSWPSGTPGVSQGWGHHTDMALIRSEIDTDVQITVSSVDGIVDNYGMTLFTGMETSTGSFARHQAWNVGYVSGVFEDPAMGDNPFGGSGLTYTTHGDESVLTFHALANQTYTLYLGGNEVGGAGFGDIGGYSVNVSAVPVPAAAWLFGTGLIGLVSMGRRKLAIA